MNKVEALELVRKELPEKRYKHTLGVVDTAVMLANKYGAHVESAEMAAILHDVAKYWSEETMTQLILEGDIPDDLLNYHQSLWHAHVGAYYLKKNGFVNQDIIKAIKYHTTGRAHMSLLEKIVFLADYIEPGRRFPGVDEVRLLAENDLDQAVMQSLINTMNLLLERGKQIHPDTVNAYNHLVKNREE